MNQQFKESGKSEDFGNGLNFERVGQLAGGGFIILLGLVFLLGESGITIFGGRSWALIALVPVYWIVFAAYRFYKLDGGLSRRVFSILIWGLIPFVYVGAAIAGLDVGAIWPIGLIAVGAGMILFNSGSKRA